MAEEHLSEFQRKQAEKLSITELYMLARLGESGTAADFDDALRQLREFQEHQESR